MTSACLKCGAPVEVVATADAEHYDCACGYSRTEYLTDEAGRRAAKRLGELIEGRHPKVEVRPLR